MWKVLSLVLILGGFVGCAGVEKRGDVHASEAQSASKLDVANAESRSPASATRACGSADCCYQTYIRTLHSIQRDQFSINQTLLMLIEQMNSEALDVPISGSRGPKKFDNPSESISLLKKRVGLLTQKAALSEQSYQSCVAN